MHATCCATGIEPDVKLGSRRRGDGDESFAEDDAPRARTLPTGRATRQHRKPPFAQISGKFDDVPPIQDGKGPAAGSRKRRDSGTNRSSRLDDDALDHHSFQTSPFRWLPVAGANDDSSIQIR